MICNTCKKEKNKLDFIGFDKKIKKNCKKCRDYANNLSKIYYYNIRDNKKVYSKAELIKRERQVAFEKGNGICSSCKLELPLVNFRNNANSGSLGYQGICKNCITKRDKFIKIKRQYNITKEEFFKILNDQNNKCKICNIDLIIFSTKHNKSNTLCIDHCHETGQVRGFLCNNCNRALGLLKDNENILISAYNYLVHYKSDELRENLEVDNPDPSQLGIIERSND